ncbi:dimethylarginine dimethylaminohydrolase family protein [Aeromicrobium sp.]|uniref:dimethylarginine dimethylaminohydrolase family protein n=1 Tax=Aeromicrobium sp. TaxID=1871063 RepID=UPI0035120E76
MSATTTDLPDLPDLPDLLWGRHYAMVEPSAYRIDYAINPFMDPARQPDAARAREQWEALVATLRGLGARVDVVAPLPDAPDMVYAMNLGLALCDAPGALPARPGGRRVVLSHMRFAQRRLETAAARQWFEATGFSPQELGPGPEETPGAAPVPHFEAGDAFPVSGVLVVGHGPRTEAAALPRLAERVGAEARGVRLVDPAMYHLDLALCPLDAEQAIVCPEALDPVSAAALLDLVPRPLVITREEALSTWCANSVVVGRTVVMPDCPPRVRRELERRGFEVALVDVGEFHLGGGSIRCLTNPLDITLGRDLAAVPAAPGVAVA